MSFSRSQCKEAIRAEAYKLGADACGFAKAQMVDDAAIAAYDQWIAMGYHGTMEYCGKYREVRNDPRQLLDKAKTVISCAFSYYNDELDEKLAKHVARYAWGQDYHWVLKSRLKRLGDYITEHYGGEYRVCVDTAPIRERYWAVKSGIGFIGINNQLIIPGKGSYFFLGEILWTGEAPPDEPCHQSCHGCLACISACPGKALGTDGIFDASKCISYLTIEHRGEIPEGTDLGGYYYGCDRCQSVCVHNSSPTPTRIEEFKPYTALMGLSVDEIMSMTPTHFRKLTSKSAMSRVTLPQMIRNIKAASDKAD